MLCRNLLRKQASTWDDVVKEVKARHSKVHMLDPAWQNAFHYVDDYNEDGFKIKAGDLGYAFKEKEPGILAHELGHKLVWEDSSDLYKKLLIGSRRATQNYNPLANLNLLLPALGIGASLATNNPYWLMGGAGLGALVTIPKLLDEYRASAKGAEVLKKLKAKQEDIDKAYGGIGNHMLSDLAIPALGLLGSGAVALLT